MVKFTNVFFLIIMGLFLSNNISLDNSSINFDMDYAYKAIILNNNQNNFCQDSTKCLNVAKHGLFSYKDLIVKIGKPLKDFATKISDFIKIHQSSLSNVVTLGAIVYVTKTTYERYYQLKDERKDTINKRNDLKSRSTRILKLLDEIIIEIEKTLYNKSINELEQMKNRAKNVLRHVEEFEKELKSHINQISDIRDENKQQFFAYGVGGTGITLIAGFTTIISPPLVFVFGGLCLVRASFEGYHWYQNAEDIELLSKIQQEVESKKIDLVVLIEEIDMQINNLGGKIKNDKHISSYIKIDKNSAILSTFNFTNVIIIFIIYFIIFFILQQNKK